MSIQRASSSIRNNQKINKITEINKVDNYYEENNLSNFIIKPKKIIKEKINIQQMADDRDEKQKNEEEDIKKNKKMVNLPYKGVIPKKNVSVDDPELNYELDYNKKIEKKDDLVVYKSKLDDKDKQKFDKKYTKFKKNKTVHDKELKEIYSENEKAKHFEKFEYNHRYKYSAKIDENDEHEDNDDLRMDRIDFYKKEQEKAENNKKNIQDVLVNLLNSGVISEDMESINYDEIDIDLIKDQIKNIGGEELLNELLE